MQGNPRQAWIPESTLWSPDSRYWIPDSLSVELGFRIPDSVRCIPDSKARDYVFPKQKFARFQNPNCLTRGKLLTVTDVQQPVRKSPSESKLVVSRQLMVLNSSFDLIG